MEFDFEKLKRDFDAAAAAREEEACAAECGGEDEGLVERVQKLMLAPARCGVYYSRLDIKVIGLRFGEDVQVRQRPWMIRDILRAVTSKEDLRRLFAIIKETGEEKIAVYDELAAHFRHAAPLFGKHKERFGRFCRELDRIVEEM